MNKKRFYITFLVIVLGFVSIYIFSLLDIRLQESAQRVEIQRYNIYRTLELVVLIVFGILIEYKKVISIFQNGIKLNRLTLVAAVSLFILLILPYNITVYLGLPYPSSIKGTISFILNSTSSRSILSLLTGILLVRSYSSTDLNKEIS